MASISSAPHHTRSNSFPNRANLTVSQFDEQLIRIRSSESASSSTNSKLSHLGNLYECLDEFLQLPSSRQALLCKGNEKCVEDALEGSIKLLDVCSIITDVFTQMKEHEQELQSVLRRRCTEEEISNEVAKYLKSKKTTIKVVSKALKDLKKMEANEKTNMINRLKECQMVTINVLESILVDILGTNGSSQGSNWQAVISKLVKSKGACQPEKAKSELEKMVIYIKDVEQGVEILFRNLINTRTTILNILNC